MINPKEVIHEKAILSEQDLAHLFVPNVFDWYTWQAHVLGHQRFDGEFSLWVA